MRNLSSYILIIMLVWPGIHMLGQYKVVDIDDLPTEYRRYAVPDVMGKVLISEGQNLASEGRNLINDDRVVASGASWPDKPLDSIPVYPGWPKSHYGPAERGGVYGNLDQDDDLEIIYIIGQSVYAYNLDGSLVGGWPVNLQYIANGAPSYGDVDGDGFGEIVVSTHRKGSWDVGKIYAFERNGTNVFGFPVTIEGGPVRTPVLADIDNDGADEIIVTVRDWPDGLVYIFKGNGTEFEGWPVRLFNVPASTVAVGDITGDNIVEIVAESYSHLYALNTLGSALEGFPYAPGNNRVFSHSTPVLADLDGDGMREIIFGDHNSVGGGGMLHVVRNDGSSFPGYPKETDFWIYSPPSIGDVNGDGSLDIIVPDYFHEITTPVNKVYGWDALTAEPLPGYPLDSVFGVFSQVLLTDLDGNQAIDLMFDSNIGPDGFYYGMDIHGADLEGWPIRVSGSSFTINPFIADLNGDGLMDISGGGFDPFDSLTAIYMWEADEIFNADYSILTTLQYNTRHNGVYGDYLMVGIGAEKPGISSFKIQVLPNPASCILNIYITDRTEGAMGLSIYDSYGRLAYKAIIPAGQQQVKLDIENWPVGIYFARGQAETLFAETAKFIITK